MYVQRDDVDYKTMNRTFAENGMRAGIQKNTPSLPIVGYTGHMPGVNSKNKHSCTFRRAAMISRNYQISNNIESQMQKTFG